MRRGFTLIEVVVVAGVVGLIAAISIASLANSRRIRDLAHTGTDALGLLQLARTKAISGEDGAQWGVRIESDRVTLFRGPDYASATLTQPHPLPAALEIVNIALAGGGTDVIFRRLDGRTMQDGSFTLRVKGATQSAFAVTIDRSGVAYRTGAASPLSGTRIIDGRHRAFTLGWSIKNSNQMKLTFEDPPSADTVNTVTMAGFFNSTKTKFDWTGTVPVGGIDQRLRAHTSSLTDANTVLLVDRDCRFSNKKMKLEIDSKLIATYEADCRTIAVGPFGGTMSEY